MSKGHAEVALAFCRECLGWEKAHCNGAVFLERESAIGGYAPGELDWLDLNAVIEAGRGWCKAQGLWISTNCSPVTSLWRLELFSYGFKSDKPVESASLCYALLAACVEANRKLNGATA